MNKLLLLIGAASLVANSTQAQTVSDNFDDNSRDTAIWGNPESMVGNEQLMETGQRLEYTAPAAEESWASQQVRANPNYNQAWQAQMLISVDQSKFGANQLGYMGIEFGGSSAGDKNIDVGRVAGDAPAEFGEFPFREAIVSGGYDPILTEDGGYLNFFKEDLPDVIGVRVTYDPDTRIIRIYYDLNADHADSEWSLFQSYTIDGSKADGAQELDWGMTGLDEFYLGVYGGAEGEVTVTNGMAWADDFAFNLGSTVRSEIDLSFFDDFDDDSRDPSWTLLPADFGDPRLVEVNHRLEFQVSSATGEQEIRQTVDQRFWPQYGQAFEVKMEAHALPADAMTTEGQVAVVELNVANNSGGGDVNFSAGAANLGGSKQPVYAVSNSEVIPPSEDADVLVLGALPDVVGLRITWAPETKTLSCYLDRDGDRSVETWVLVADYTLDGIDRGAAFTTDWQMFPTDQFRITLNGFAEDTIIDPGEAFFENFSLVNAPLVPELTGYDLWASELDEGLRDTAIDASGNGIPNLLQYMYGLAPMSTDTDVKLTIQMENGVPVLIHGFNEAAGDYVFDYLEKSFLGDPTWNPAALPASTEFQLNGKTFRKTVLSADLSSKFLRLRVVNQL